MFLLLNELYGAQVLKQMHGYINENYPYQFKNSLSITEIYNYNTRQRTGPHVQPRRTSAAAKSIIYKGPLLWAKVPVAYKKHVNGKVFMRNYKNTCLIIAGKVQYNSGTSKCHT